MTIHMASRASRFIQSVAVPASGPRRCSRTHSFRIVRSAGPATRPPSPSIPHETVGGPRLEVQRDAVDAVALAGRRRAVVEDMAEMAAAGGAMHFGARHDQLVVLWVPTRSRRPAPRSSASRCRNRTSPRRNRPACRSRRRHRGPPSCCRSAGWRRAARSPPRAARRTARASASCATRRRSCETGKLSFARAEPERKNRLPPIAAVTAAALAARKSRLAMMVSLLGD